MAEELLTIKEIGKRLDLPESNIRYYRDKFEDFLPYVGQGRKRRYKPEALKIFSFISERLKNNVPSEEIARELAHNFPKNAQVHSSGFPALPGHDQLLENSFSSLVQSQARALEDLSTTIKNSSGDHSTLQAVRKNQNTLKRALLLLWKKQQRLESSVERFSARPEYSSELKDSVLDALSARVGKLEAALNAQHAPSQSCAPQEVEDHISDISKRLDVIEKHAPFSAVADMQDRVEALSLGLESEARERGELALMIEALREEVTPIQDQEEDNHALEQTRDHLRVLAERVDTLAEQVSLARQDNAKSKAFEEITSLRSDMASVSARLDSLPDSLTREEASALESKIDSFHEKLEQMHQGLDALSSRMDQLSDAGSFDSELDRIDKWMLATADRLDQIEEKNASDMQVIENHLKTCWAGMKKLAGLITRNDSFRN
ncbi:MAG: MerR family transcriptional regulator [Desulfovibrionales bacterium]